MKEFYIDLHSQFCPCGKNKELQWYETYCELNPERFLFFVGTKFILVTYHKCLQSDEYDFKKDLINSCIENNKILERWEINRGVNIEKDLKDFRIRNQSLRKYIEQVNYLYSDICGEKYGITTRTKYLDAICNQEEIDKNYLEAKEFIMKSKYEWLLEQLTELYNINRVWDANETEYHKTIEHLVQSINQLTK